MMGAACTAGLRAMVLLLLLLPLGAQAQKQVALTFDDLLLNGPDAGWERLVSMHEKLLATLAKEKIPSVGYVNEAKIAVVGETDKRVALLEGWLKAGHLLANHTFSHSSYHQVGWEQHRADIERGDIFTRPLMKKYGHELKYFRSPYLYIGDTEAAQKQLQDYLDAHGYVQSPVTLDASDWYYTVDYVKAKNAGDEAAMKKVAQTYLAFNSAKLDFMEAASEKMFSRQIKQIFLLHANELNADYLDELVALLRERGYDFISLDEALTDEVYQRPVRPFKWGIHWFYRWDIPDAQGQTLIDWSKEPEHDSFKLQ